MNSVALYQAEQKVYTANPKHELVHKAVRLSDYGWFKGGLGSGKTTAGAIQAIMEVYHYQPGQSGLTIAPTYKMLHDSTLTEFFRWLPRHFIESHNKSLAEITLKNGTTITYRSGDDPDTLRGPNKAWLWMDEPRNFRTRE